MKSLAFYILFLSSSIINAYEVKVTDQAVSENVKIPTVQVDIFGNKTWKYPVDFFDSPKVEQPTKQADTKKNKTELPKKKMEKRYASFIPGQNTKWTIQGSYFMFGSLHGANASMGYSSGYLSHNIEIYKLKNEVSDYDVEVNTSMINYRLDFHAFPQYLINNKQMRVFDGGGSIIIGYSKNELNNGMNENSPTIGLGAFLSYPIIHRVNLKGTLNVIHQPSNKTIDKNSSTGGLGLTVDF